MNTEKPNSAGPKVVSIQSSHNILFDSGTIRGQEDVLGFGPEPQQMDSTGIFICLRGKVWLTIEEKDYCIQEGGICVVFPYMVVQVHKKTDDFEGHVLGGNSGFVYTLNFQSAILIFLFIKDNPCIQLAADELRTLLSLYAQLNENNERYGHLYRYEILELLLTVFCYEIAAIYQKRRPQSDDHYTRKQVLFFRFIQLLYAQYHTHRNASYYADNLCISPRYLSIITKEIVGFTADECITRIVIKNARLLLSSTRLSIQEVSDKLNFPNPSFFGQYFKKNTGMTPKEFRNQYR